jgi:hypothetical protein
MTLFPASMIWKGHHYITCYECSLRALHNSIKQPIPKHPFIDLRLLESIQSCLRFLKLRLEFQVAILLWHTVSVSSRGNPARGSTVSISFLSRLSCSSLGNFASGDTSLMKLFRKLASFKPVKLFPFIKLSIQVYSDCDIKVTYDKC